MIQRSQHLKLSFKFFEGNALQDIVEEIRRPKLELGKLIWRGKEITTFHISVLQESLVCVVKTAAGAFMMAVKKRANFDLNNIYAVKLAHNFQVRSQRKLTLRNR